jgi:hypothetical protein
MLCLCAWLSAKNARASLSISTHSECSFSFAVSCSSVFAERELVFDRIDDDDDDDGDGGDDDDRDDVNDGAGDGETEGYTASK